MDKEKGKVKNRDELLELRDRMEAIAGIRRGLESMECGKGRPAEEFFEEFRKKHNVTAM